MRVNKTYDELLLLHDGGLVTASGAGNIGTGHVAQILDLGGAGFAGEMPATEGDVVIDVAAIEVDSSNEICTIGVQISSSATFASDIYEICSLSIGDSVPLAGDTDMGVGRYILPFQNRIGDGTAKRYLRIYYTIAGTIATGFNFTAYLAKKASA